MTTIDINDPEFLRTKNWQVLDIEQARVGAFEIVHDYRDPGASFPTSTLRAQLIGGQGNTPLVFPDATCWHKLIEHGVNDDGEPDTGTWMTDYPMEQVQLDRHLPDMMGSVLVGGLGLGYAVTQLADRDEVLEIVCVEISPEVIELVEPWTMDHGKLRVVNADLHDYLANCDRTFDTAFYDTWAPDSVAVFVDTVMPLREASRGIVTGEIACWNEDVMRGQLYSVLTSRLAMIIMGGPEGEEIKPEMFAVEKTGEGAEYSNWQVPFWQALVDGRIAQGDNPMDSAAARFYADNYGLEAWAEKWSNYKSN